MSITDSDDISSYISLPDPDRIDTLLGPLKFRRLLREAERWGSPPKQDRSVHHRSTHPQSKSSFFSKLPLEIRILIFDQVFEILGFRGSIHIQKWRSGKRLAATRCELGEVRPIQPGEEFTNHGWIYLHDVFTHLGAPHRMCRLGWRDENFMHGCLPLLTSCKRAYFEAIGILYGGITFHLEQIPAASRFLSLFPQQHLQNIKSLDFSWKLHAPIYNSTPVHHRSRVNEFAWDKRYAKVEEKQWERTCAIIACMSSLSRLKIAIYDDGHIVPEEALLRPLIGINVEDFVVQLPWPLMIANDPVEQGVGFQIRRPPEYFDVLMQIDIGLRGIQWSIRRLVGKILTAIF